MKHKVGHPAQTRPKPHAFPQEKDISGVTFLTSHPTNGTTIGVSSKPYRAALKVIQGTSAQFTLDPPNNVSTAAVANAAPPVLSEVMPMMMIKVRSRGSTQYPAMKPMTK